MNFIIENWEQIFAVITAAVTVASAIAAITPSETDNRIVSKIKKVVDVIAINVKNAKSAPSGKKLVK
jgi:hypothetical protein